MPKSVGEIISELRKEAGFTQHSLAEALHITDKAVSKWERNLSMPDSLLLPKLSRLLDSDIELLIANTEIENKEWVGVIDLRNYDIDLQRDVAGRPLVYYLLVHYILLGIKKIYINTNEKNGAISEEDVLAALGLEIILNESTAANENVMLLRRPVFLFGSDLTRKFQASMCIGEIVKLVPEGCPETFIFCPHSYIEKYHSDYELMTAAAKSRTLGRGMVCIDVSDEDGIRHVEKFVEIYETNCGKKIADLNELIEKYCRPLV